MEKKRTRWRWLMRRCSAGSPRTCRRGTSQWTQGLTTPSSEPRLRLFQPELLVWQALAPSAVLILGAGFLFFLLIDKWLNIDQLFKKDIKKERHFSAPLAGTEQVTFYFQIRNWKNLLIKCIWNISLFLISLFTGSVYSYLLKEPLFLEPQWPH